MSDRIVVMSQGRIEQLGTPREIYFQPRTHFVAGFFGDNNLIPGTMAGPDAVDTALGRLPITANKQHVSGAKVLLAIRPESLSLGAGKVSIAAEVVEAMFGGALTKLLLRCKNAPDITLNMRLAGNDRASVLEVGAPVTVTYDPADAVVIGG